MEAVKVVDIHSAKAALRALAEEKCEGCRLSWKLRDERHGEPMPMQCVALGIRQSIIDLSK
jgi:hypothetical protein